jgi:hypothetical protein
MRGWRRLEAFLQARFFPPIRQVIFFAPFIAGFIKEIAALVPERADREREKRESGSKLLCT